MKKKILLTGGGTAGSVVPLLAIVDELKKKLSSDDLTNNFQSRNLNNSRLLLAPFRHNLEFAWIGTRKGIEREMVVKEGIKYSWIASGKVRRYFSLMNFIDPIFILAGMAQTFLILIFNRPKIILSAGSFVSVPVAWIAWILRIPFLVHQQDMRPGLANILMAPFARVITVTFEKSVNDYGEKAVVVGNFIRDEIQDMKIRHDWAMEKLGLKKGLPIVLVMGGGTGALAINNLIKKSLNELTKFCQVVHITGKNKNINEDLAINNYRPYEFCNIEGMLKNYVVADLIISRCGMGALTEISYLEKPAILIPMPDSHQEDNVEIFREKNAAIVLKEEDITARDICLEVKKILHNDELKDTLKRNIRGIITTDAQEKIITIIEKEINGFK